MLGMLVSQNPGMGGTFEVDSDGKNLSITCPPLAIGLPKKFAGMASVSRQWVLHWLVANSSLAHGMPTSPLSLPQLEFSKLSRCFSSRHHFPILRFPGGDGPFEQMYGLHFSWYKDKDAMSSSLAPMGVAQPL